MATQLKDLRFNDYTLKGETNNSYTHFVLGENDSIGYIETSSGGGSSEYHPIVGTGGSGSTVWWFHGIADKADFASVTTSGVDSFKKLYGKAIPTFSKSGSSATVDELEDWIKTFVNEFSGGSSCVIAGTYQHSM